MICVGLLENDLVFKILNQRKEAEHLLRFFVAQGYSYYIFSEKTLCGTMQANRRKPSEIESSFKIE